MSLKIKLSQTAPRVCQQMVRVGEDNIFRTDSARFLRAPKPMRSENANTCLMVGINAGNNRNCLMHLAPEQQSLSTLKAGLLKCIKTLSEKCDNMKENFSAILIGGRAFDSNNPKTKASFDLFNHTANILEELGIPFSMICGKYDNVAKDNISVYKDCATIWNDSYKNLDIPKNATLEEIEEALSEHYQVVELSKEAPVEIE